MSTPPSAEDPLDGVTSQLEQLLQKLRRDLQDKESTIVRRRNQIKRLERVVKLLRAETGVKAPKDLSAPKGPTPAQFLCSQCGNHVQSKAHKESCVAAETEAAAETNAR